MDCKKAAKQFTELVGCQAKHHLNYVTDGVAACLFGGVSQACTLHQGTACDLFPKSISPDGRPDVIIAGPPCAPYSAQRSGRFKKTNGSCSGCSLAAE